MPILIFVLLLFPLPIVAREEAPKLYWAAGGEIHRSNLNGSDFEEGLVKADPRRPSRLLIDEENEKVYWVDGPLTGSAVYRSGFYGENERVYWAEALSGFAVYRSDLDGSNLEIVHDLHGWWLGVFPPLSLVIDSAQGRLYWGGYVFDLWAGDAHSWGILQWMDLDWKEKWEDWMDPWAPSEFWCAYPSDPIEHGVWGLASDPPRRRMFFTNGDSQRIFYVNLDSLYLHASSFENSFADEWGFRPPLGCVDEYWYDSSLFESFQLVDSGRARAIATDQGKIYWVQREGHDPVSSSLWQADLGTLSPQLVTDSFSSWNFDVHGEKLYWIEPDYERNWYGQGLLKRSNLDGSSVEHDFPGGFHSQSSVLDFEFHDGWIYWTDSRLRIRRLDLGSSTIEDVFASRTRSIDYLFSDSSAGRLYWTDRVAGTIQSSNLDGSNVETLVSDQRSPSRPLLVDGQLYWADVQVFRRLDSGSSEIEDVFRSRDFASLAFGSVEKRLYWSGSCSTSENFIWMANLDGSGLDSLSVGQGVCPSDLAVHEPAAHIYWTWDRSIWRTSLANGSSQMVKDTDSDQVSFALDPLHGKVYWSSVEFPPCRECSARGEFYRSNLDGTSEELLWGYDLDSGISDLVLYLPNETSVDQVSPSSVPTSLDVAFPNPFNSSTTVSYSLESRGPVRLVVYNVLGQPVRTLVDATQFAGSYQVAWDSLDDRGAPVASGVYLARLTHKGSQLVQQLLYLK